MDREKVIKEFEHILNEARGDYLDFADITVYFGDEILTLLKEQEAVVRCKDCKHQREYKMGSCPYYTTYGLVPPDGWFCAGGKRKENGRCMTGKRL